jgi:DUF1680 family protein
MKSIRYFRIKYMLPVLGAGIILFGCKGSEENEKPVSGYPISPVDFTSVILNDDFWKPRLRTSIEVTVPSSLEKCMESGRIENFKIAAGLSEGAFQTTYPYDDSDVYKILEGASYALALQPDSSLDRYLDRIISYIAAAQEPDGYLQTWRTIDPTHPPTDWSGSEERWSNLASGHELYNMGHLYEAAVAHYRSTGKRTLLDVAIKNAGLILDTFGPGKIETPPGHQEIEIGLVKLYQVTGKEEYIDMAKFFLDQRGKGLATSARYDASYNQDHLPVSEQSEAVGHAVRAGYMYAAMTDIAAITGDTAYRHAVDRIWSNVVNKKMYLTGGTGALRAGERFGENYELPNFSAYSETCAAIATILWNQRMFLMTGNGKYIDVLERALYNAALAGVSLSGDRFFYPNPLASDGEEPFNMGSCTRSPWFDCSCCPANVTRFIPSLPGYVYATRGNELYINLFVGNSTNIERSGVPVNIRQYTAYPWGNTVTIELSPERPDLFDLHIRIPGWANDQVLPGTLYHYLEKPGKRTSISVNGMEQEVKVINGYATISREWNKGDLVELELPMGFRRVAANERIQTNAGKVAVEYPPLVYCAEQVDNEVDIFSVITVPEQPNIESTFQKNLLGGIRTITIDVPTTPGTVKNGLTELNLIPYYAWSNRGANKMTVWFPAK